MWDSIAVIRVPLITSQLPTCQQIAGLGKSSLRGPVDVFPPFFWSRPIFLKKGTPVKQSAYPSSELSLYLSFDLLIGSPKEEMAEVMISIRISDGLILDFIKVV